MRSRVFVLAITFLLMPISFVSLQTPHWTRTPAALAYASQVQDSGARKAAPEVCPVTKSPAQPFVPPPPYWTDHGSDQFWYGTESLWTLLAVKGTWNIHNNVLESQGAYRTKLTYWQRGFDWRKEPKPDLIVVAKRLDRDAPPIAGDQANAVFVTTDKPGIMTGIDIPSIGCWEITARYHAQSLSFVVSVEP